MIEIVNKLIDICNNKSRGKSNSSSALARKKLLTRSIGSDQSITCS